MFLISWRPCTDNLSFTGRGHLQMGASSGHHFAMRPLAQPPWLDFSMILLLLFGRSWKGPEKLCVCWVLCSKGHRISCLIKACHELLESFPLIPAGFSLSSSYSLALDCPPTVFYWASHSAYSWSYICMNLGCKLQKPILETLSRNEFVEDIC